MPTTEVLSITQLRLDLNNYRTVPQKKESDAIQAMIAIDPDWFWALMESLLADGYHPTENIIVQRSEKSRGECIVKEGNRRIGALRIICGHVKLSDSLLPSHIEEKIAQLDKAWKKTNSEVPCAIYESHETEVVDRIVTLIHGKGEKAGRRVWKAVARARHNRDKTGASEPGLDLLEEYLRYGKNLTALQRDRWGGDYPLTVLDEAIKKFSSRFGLATSRELADNYPEKIKHRTTIENILYAVGVGDIDFKKLRNNDDEYFRNRYGIPTASKAAGASSEASSVRRRESGTKKDKAVSTDDPKAVVRALKAFIPKGKHRDKLVTLLKEARDLKLDRHPHAFCFLLRSMFEISAKAYCLDHKASGGPSYTKANGDDRPLVDILRDITKHLTKNNTDKQMKKALHGAMTEIGKKEGILSVTSMNQLVHNPRFSVKGSDISALFGNIFPLLEEMNY